MNHKKSITLNLIAILIVAVSMSSCMTTKTTVGTYKELQGEEYTYAKGKQAWIFWGLVPLGRTDLSTPQDGSCEVITRQNFGDVLISSLTVGLFKTHTIKVVAKRKSIESEQ